MAFFKPEADKASNKFIARLHMLIWTLIYAGLLTSVLGLSVQRSDDTIGWSMVVIGGFVAAVGFALIYVRSKLDTEP
jgi:Na+/H+-dicarboxylate symporter